ncbi:DUF4052 family protein [Bacillus paranthracis]|uniref:DUF4052 family protein n=1 Tax=Bacillus paranthracis TaxID=2026186 RepID=UPI000A3A23F4|nr:hypothetical protein BK786_20825 [Bacillus thuringiensis serovar thailandensis]
MELVYKITYHRMQDHYLPKLIQAISFVSEEDLWKQGDSVNSIGGIVLHICEHIQRNTSRYKNPNIVFEKGIEEYFPVKRQRTELLLQYVEEVFNLLFTSDGSLVNIPYFTVISIGLTVLYIITSSIFIRKVSFEKTI